MKKVTEEQETRFAEKYKTGVDEHGKLLYLRDEMIYGSSGPSTQATPQP